MEPQRRDGAPTSGKAPGAKPEQRSDSPNGGSGQRPPGARLRVATKAARGRASEKGCKNENRLGSRPAAVETETIRRSVQPAVGDMANRLDGWLQKQGPSPRLARIGKRGPHDNRPSLAGGRKPGSKPNQLGQAAAGRYAETRADVQKRSLTTKGVVSEN